MNRGQESVLSGDVVRIVRRRFWTEGLWLLLRLSRRSLQCRNGFFSQGISRAVGIANTDSSSDGR